MALLKPCRCGEEINYHFRVEILSGWSARYHYNIGVGYCSICGEAEPFKYYDSDTDHVNNRATIAWNKAREEERKWLIVRFSRSLFKRYVFSILSKLSPISMYKALRRGRG